MDIKQNSKPVVPRTAEIIFIGTVNHWIAEKNFSEWKPEPLPQITCLFHVGIYDHYNQ